VPRCRRLTPGVACSSGERRPVTPEVAGSSPVAPVSVLQVGLLLFRTCSRIKGLEAPAFRDATLPFDSGATRAAAPTSGEAGRVGKAPTLRFRWLTQKLQLPGSGSSIRLAAPAGTSDATTVTRSTLPSFRTM